MTLKSNYPNYIKSLRSNKNMKMLIFNINDKI